MKKFKPVTPEEAQELLEPCTCDDGLDGFECVATDYGLTIDSLERMARTIVAVGKTLEKIGERGAEDDSLSESQRSLILGEIWEALGVNYEH